DPLFRPNALVRRVTQTDLDTTVVEHSFYFTGGPAIATNKQIDNFNQKFHPLMDPPPQDGIVSIGNWRRWEQGRYHLAELARYATGGNLLALMGVVLDQTPRPLPQAVMEFMQTHLLGTVQPHEVADPNDTHVPPRMLPLVVLNVLGMNGWSRLPRGTWLSCLNVESVVAVLRDPVTRNVIANYVFSGTVWSDGLPHRLVRNLPPALARPEQWALLKSQYRVV